MKKLILLGILAIGMMLLSTSCKKEQCEPEIITNMVHDTVHNNTTVHDTVTVVGMDLIGIWTVYKIETISSSTTNSSSVNYKYNFTTTKLLQDLDNNGIYEYNYNATYGTSYVDIYFTSTPLTHAISTVGKEYRLTSVSGGQTTISYLKK